jgi:dTDP-4-amino-4,6-dideoxygalactose transaminase
MMPEAIGGYFGLELSQNEKSFHFEDNFIALNSARNCLEYILRAREYQKVFIPYYTCDVILEPFELLGIPYAFYDVNDLLEPIFDYDILEEKEAFLYTNYFGLKTEFVQSLSLLVKNLIVDNAQALFARPTTGVDTFYSPRKFIGVADGGFLATDEKIELDLEYDYSFERMSHLLKRIDLSAEEGYDDFCCNDQSLERQPIKRMSKLTSQILQSVDVEFITNRRRQNYAFLHDKLKSVNLLKIEMTDEEVPMVYPLRVKNVKELKKKLNQNQIYCATYWTNVLGWCGKDKNAFHLTNEIIAIPIDQRYDEKHLEIIINLIRN